MKQLRPNAVRCSAVLLQSLLWTGGPLDHDEETLLTRLERHIPRAGDRPRHYFFAREGFTESMRRLAAADPDRYRLVTVDEMYAT